MSPQNKKKLNSLRKQLDKLDNDMLKIVKKRTNIIKNKSFKALNFLFS